MATTAINTIDGYIDDELKEYGVTSQTTAEVIYAINEAIQEIQVRLEPLKDDFAINVVQNTHTYQIDSTATFPYRLDAVWYNISANEVRLTKASREVTKAGVAASNTVITRYSFYKDGANSTLQLNGLPAANKTAGLIPFGPYMPTWVAAGGDSPFDIQYDFAIEMLAVAKLVKQYVPSEAAQKRATDNAEAAIAKLQGVG